MGKRTKGEFTADTVDELEVLKETTDSLIEHMERVKAAQTEGEKSHNRNT